MNFNWIVTDPAQYFGAALCVVIVAWSAAALIRDQVTRAKLRGAFVGLLLPPAPFGVHSFVTVVPAWLYMTYPSLAQLVLGGWMYAWGYAAYRLSLRLADHRQEAESDPDRAMTVRDDTRFRGLAFVATVSVLLVGVVIAYRLWPREAPIPGHIDTSSAYSAAQDDGSILITELPQIGQPALLQDAPRDGLTRLVAAPGLLPPGAVLLVENARTGATAEMVPEGEQSPAAELETRAGDRLYLVLHYFETEGVEPPQGPATIVAAEKVQPVTSSEQDGTGN